MVVGVVKPWGAKPIDGMDDDFVMDRVLEAGPRGGIVGARNGGAGGTVEPAACAFDRLFCVEGAASAFWFPISGDSGATLR
jgi:hypothetical protein